MKKIKLIVKKYPIYPSYYINQEQLKRRVPNEIKVKFLVEPPTSGRKMAQWRRIRTHITEQVQLFSVMSTDELFIIKQAIEQEKLPHIFLSIINLFYRNKSRFEPALGEVTINDFELFDYEGPHALAKNVQQSSRFIPNMPRIRLPVTTSA